MTIRQVIENVQQLAGGGEPQFGAVPYRAGENMALYADIAKAQRLLGWRPKTSLKDGLDRTIAAIRNG